MVPYWRGLQRASRLLATLWSVVPQRGEILHPSPPSQWPRRPLSRDSCPRLLYMQTTWVRSLRLCDKSSKVLRVISHNLRFIVRKSWNHRRLCTKMLSPMVYRDLLKSHSWRTIYRTYICGWLIFKEASDCARLSGRSFADQNDIYGMFLQRAGHAISEYLFPSHLRLFLFFHFKVGTLQTDCTP